MIKQEPHRIVILGAGFAGLRVALELEKRCARMRQCEITLIDTRREHVYTPLLYEVCTGALERPADECVGELASGVCIRFEEYSRICGSKRLRFKRGEVVGLDAQAKEVILKEDGRVPYDDLVLALGVGTATFNIPGVATHAYFMKTLEDALRMHQRLYQFVRAYKEGNEERISVVVGGGGPTGSEFAAELANFFGKLVQAGLLKREDYDITLAEAGSDILSMYRESIRRHAHRRLQKLGVTVMADTVISEVKQDSAVLMPRPLKPGETDSRKSPLSGPTEREADLVVWTGGIKPFEVVKQIGVPTDDRGFVLIDSDLAIQGMEHAFALGDCAAVVDQKMGKRVPALAQSAVREASVLAENIVRHLERRPTIVFQPPGHWNTIVPLGGKYAIADLGWFHIAGWPAYVLRKCADLAYFCSILPPFDALRLWVRGARVYIRND